MDEGLTIQEAAERVGLSADTLRYYEKAGLLPRAVRTIGGQRRYAAEHLGGIVFVNRMRATGMPIRRIREYMEIPVDADGRSVGRRQILVEHQLAILDKLEALNDALELIRKKIDIYDTNGLVCSSESDHSARELEAV
jgi:DNA-binding transcriptional MerR regulator